MHVCQALLRVRINGTYRLGEEGGSYLDNEKVTITAFARETTSRFFHRLSFRYHQKTLIMIFHVLLLLFTCRNKRL